jgi:hypothetical protein
MEACYLLTSALKLEHSRCLLHDTNRHGRAVTLARKITSLFSWEGITWRRRANRKSQELRANVVVFQKNPHSKISLYSGLLYVLVSHSLDRSRYVCLDLELSSIRHNRTANVESLGPNFLEFYSVLRAFDTANLLCYLVEWMLRTESVWINSHLIAVTQLYYYTISTIA